jgi:hypothetical protein
MYCKMREVTKVCLHLLIAAGGGGRSRSPVLHRPAAVLPPTGEGVVPKYINSIGMLDSHSDTAHAQGWQFVTSLVESKASDSYSVRMVQM